MAEQLQQQFYNACVHGRLKDVQRLVNLGVNFRTDNDYAVHLASSNGHLNILQYLINLGADFRVDNNYAICVASECGYLDVVKYLVEVGADFQADNNMPIRSASEFGHFDVIKYLVRVGANFRDDNNAAIRMASKYEHYDIVKYLLSLGAYHPDIQIGYDLINCLYSEGKFDLVHKLIHNNNCNIENKKNEQFNFIKNSINKIIVERKWNSNLLSKLIFLDVIVQFNLS